MLSWQKVRTQGNAAMLPGKLAYHSTVVYKDSAYIFGGNNYDKSSTGLKVGSTAPENSIIY